MGKKKKDEFAIEMRKAMIGQYLKNPIITSKYFFNDEKDIWYLFRAGQNGIARVGKVIDETKRFVTTDKNGVINKEDKNEYMRCVYLDDKARVIADSAFSQCDELECFVANSKLESIGNFAFSECDRLKYIELNEGLKEIGVNAFYGCDEINENKIFIPGSVKKFGERVFDKSSVDDIYTTKEVAELYVKTNTDLYSKSMNLYAIEGDKLYIYKVSGKFFDRQKVVRTTYKWEYPDDGIFELFNYGIDSYTYKSKVIEKHKLDLYGDWKKIEKTKQ